jgi:ABC-type phosphate/phosphonate transport system substrate-binding protein
MPADTVSKMRESMLKCSNRAILNSIKAGATGFVEYRAEDYNDLRRIMRRVNER